MVIAPTQYSTRFRHGWSTVRGGTTGCAAADDPSSPLGAGAQPKQAAPEIVPWKLRILIIEDNRDLADNLQLLLELMGHQATVAYTGPEGIETAVRELPDLVISDIGLPGLTGFDVAQALRGNPATASTHLVAVTGYGSPAVQKQALACGFDAYFVKPVETADILKVVLSRQYRESAD